tara:strand:- start:239 stop:538 length:300 start_codon:yes stop_codon:yes gene_type:complete
MEHKDLEAIRKRVEAASDTCELTIRNDGSDFADYMHLADAQFIAHARTDVPALLDEVHALRHLLMRACGEIFGGVVMRPFMIEELRKHHVVEPPHSQDK